MTTSNEQTQIAVMQNDITYIKQALDDLKEHFKNTQNDYVHKSEFSNLKSVVYSFIGATLITLISIILKLLY